MSGGYRTPAKDDADAIKRHLESHSDAIQILQRPTGEQLANIIAEVNMLVVNLIVPQVGSASTSGFLLGSSFGNVTSFNFTVPAGCTRVLVSAGGSVSAPANTAGSGVLETRIVIQGIAGPIGATQTSAASQVPAVPAFGAASLTGLTAGSTVSVVIQAFVSGTTITSLTNASVAGTALFLP